MTGWGSRCFLVRGLIAGCSWTSEAFLVTRVHHGFLSRTWLYPRYRASLECSWPRILWALWPSLPWPKGPGANLPCSPLLEEFPVPRLSSAFSLSQERADWGAWVGLDHTSHRASVWKFGNVFKIIISFLHQEKMVSQTGLNMIFLMEYALTS